MSVAAESPAPAGRDVRSVFHIAKSENANEVHYGVRVDARCLARGAEPVYPYWVMNARGGTIEGLLDIEQAAYGIAPGQTVERSASGSTIQLRLRPLPDRGVEVETFVRDGRCLARARTLVAGASAWLDEIFVQLRWPFGVEFIRLFGTRSSDGAQVSETLRSE